MHFHTNHNCESRPDETASPAASASKRSFGNKRKRRVSTGQVSGALSFGHWTFIYYIPYLSQEIIEIYIFHMCIICFPSIIRASETTRARAPPSLQTKQSCATFQGDRVIYCHCLHSHCLLFVLASQERR